MQKILTEDSELIEADVVSVVNDDLVNIMVEEVSKAPTEEKTNFICYSIKSNC